jgi:hypothetical protein
MVRNKPKSWSEATIYTRLDAEYWRVQYPSGDTVSSQATARRAATNAALRH